MSSKSTNRSPRSVRVLAAVAAMFVAAGVTGCDAEEVGAAALIGDEKYTVGELQSDVKSIANVPGSALDLNADLTEIQSQLITEKVQSVVFDHLAEAEDIDVTEADIDMFIDEQVAPNAPEGDLDALLAQNNFTEERLRRLVRVQLISNQLFENMGQDNQALSDAVAAAADDLGVVVNPRYGEWEGNTVSVVSGSVSVPESGAGPAETPSP